MQSCWCCLVLCSAVPHLQHVPLLPETVRRLLLPPYMANHVQYIKSDRQHGAAELAAYVLQALRAVLAYEEKSEHQIHLQTSRTAGTAAGAAAGGEQQQQQQPHEVSFEHWMEAYTTLCFLMAVARPSMAAVANAAAEVMLQVQHELEARAEPFEPTAGVARCVHTAENGIRCSCCRIRVTLAPQSAGYCTINSCADWWWGWRVGVFGAAAM